MNNAKNLLERIQVGDREALALYIATERENLQRMAGMRIHPSLRSRFDFSDVIQEVMVESINSLDAYLQNPKLPIRLWVRSMLNKQLGKLHRYHLDAQKRNARLETSPNVQSDILAENFLAKNTPPLDAVLRQERKKQIQDAIDRLDPIDQEILALRHFEQLDINETAQVLSIKVEAAFKRHMRALKRLKTVLNPPSGELSH